MLAVDVGGTFTDVVAIRDGRIEVTKVPSDPSRPEQPVVEGARRLGVEGSPVFNHASTMGLNAVITRRLPKIGFLTTEGHRDMLDRGRVWRPLDAQTDAAWRRPFGDAARPLVPRYLRRGVHERILADGCVLMAARRGAGPPPARGARTLRRRRASPICLLNSYVDPAHEQRLRELAREVLGDVPISLSSEISPLAKEYARASTTVVDVLMKLIYTDYAEQLDRDLRGLGFDGELNFADCAATLLPWHEALEKPFRIVFAGPAAGTVSSTRFGRGARRRQPALLRRRRHLDRHLPRRRRPAVRRQHLRARARPAHQRAVDGDLERRRRRRQHRLDLAVGRRARRARQCRRRSGTGLLRARRRGADADRRLPAHGHPRPRRVRRGRAAARFRPGAQGLRVARHAAAARPADRVRVPDRGREHRRRGAEHRHPPRRRPARLHASWPTAPPGRCCCPRRSSSCA